jgi:hypothetical protein
VERRPKTTVPQQALFAMNAPFVLEQAQALAARSELAGIPEPHRKVDRMYQVVFGRSATRAERERAVRFVQEAGRDPSLAAGHLDPWSQLAQALLMSNEFIFLD